MVGYQLINDHCSVTVTVLELVDYGNTESNPSDRLVSAFGFAASGAVNRNPCPKQSTGTAV